MLNRKEKIDYKDYSKNKKTSKTNKKTGKNKFIRLYIAFVILVGIILVVYIGQLVKITHLNYKIESLQVKLNKIEDSNHHLKLKLAKKSSLSHIEEVARNKLNMTDPKETQIIVLNKKSSSHNSVKNKKENNTFFHAIQKIMNRIRTVKAGSPE
mgnify:CR=1 FL=1